MKSYWFLARHIGCHRFVRPTQRKNPIFIFQCTLLVYHIYAKSDTNCYQYKYNLFSELKITFLTLAGKTATTIF